MQIYYTIPGRVRLRMFGTLEIRHDAEMSPRTIQTSIALSAILIFNLDYNFYLRFICLLRVSPDWLFTQIFEMSGVEW
jgi:hypothetical protein